MELEKPFDGKSIRPFSEYELKSLSKSMLENVIRYCELSKNAGKYISNIVMPSIMADNELDSDMSSEFKNLLNYMKTIKRSL